MNSRRLVRLRRLGDLIWPKRSVSKVIELNTLAQYWGAIGVVYRARSVHGYTEWTPRGPIICISVAKSDGRRRATLAHECIHLVLDPLFQPSALVGARRDDLEKRRRLVLQRLGTDLPAIEWLLADSPSYEALCDQVAVELLMPAARVPQIIRSTRSVDDLRSECEQRRISLSLMVNRMNTFGGQFCLLRLFPTPTGDWIITEASGLPKHIRGRIVCTSDTSTRLSHLRIGNKQRSTQSGPIPLELCHFTGNFILTATIERHYGSATAFGSRASLVQDLR